jgi:hypothetical protein
MLLALAACLVLGFSSLWMAAQNESLRRRVASAGSARTAAPETAPLVASLTLSSDTTRGEAAPARLALPGGAELVRLALTVHPAEPYQQYAVTVASGDRRLWERQPLAAQGQATARAVVLWLPAAALPPGRIQVRLDGMSETQREPVGFYEFEVVAR